jgi:arabinofuranosyltransferase
LGAGLLGYAVLAYLSAWLSDDALISLRTASNALDGYGLRWNVGERVQTFTHPLWLFVLTFAHAFTGEPFYSSLWVSLLVSVAAVGCILFGVRTNLADKTIALCALIFSQAFMDFSSSGLENPLTHLFIAAFAVVYTTQQRTGRARALWLSSIAGLAAFNRLDTMLLFAPALVGEVVRKRDLRWHLVGALPIVGWELFSLLYYGFPFPNTAYAKLTQASTAGDKLIIEGFNYLRNSFANDPLTLGLIGSCVGLALVRRRFKYGLLLVGALAYVAYVINIGGDFMSGRFLSAPFFLSLAWLISSHVLRERWWQATAAMLVIALGMNGRWPPPLTGADFRLAEGESEVDEFGIHNERRMFFAINSLRHAEHMNPLRRDHPWSRQGFSLHDAAEHDSRERVKAVDAIGHAGYFAGPNVHIVDRWALADALIARLPALSGRYGHYPRVIPEGYIASLLAHADLLADRDLAAYYRELEWAIKGPLFAPERLRAIWHLNTSHSIHLDKYAFIRHSPVTVRLRVTNPTTYCCITSYVWNDARTSSYVIDNASSLGKSYELMWQVSRRGAQMLEPRGVPASTQLTDLRERGMFTISVAFMSEPGGPLRDLHELRYTYELVHGEPVIQRQPAQVWVQNFPTGPWHEFAWPGVLRVLETN